MIGRVLLERRPVHIVDVMADAEYLQGHTEDRRISHAAWSPAASRRFSGRRHRPRAKEVRPFSEREIALVSTFADQATLAIENARLFETVERQRTELARFAPQVASMLSSEEGKSLLTGHRREITALFCDLRGSPPSPRPPSPRRCLACSRIPRHGRPELVCSWRHGRALCGGWADGLLQRSCAEAGAPERRDPRGARHARGVRHSRGALASARLRPRAWGSGSRLDTPPLAVSASKADTTMGQSATW